MKVIIYSSPTCCNCMLAKNHMKSLGIKFEERDIRQEEVRQELINMSCLSLPVVIVDGVVYRDYDIEKMNKVFGGGIK